MSPRRLLLLLSFALATSTIASPAEAAKYMSLGQAVKSFIPKGSKIFKVKKKLSASQKVLLRESYGWTPDKDVYEFYVGKKGEERVAYVFIVPEIFNTCFHKYAVGMDAGGKILETVIVELSCPRAFPINRKSFLSQFSDKKHHDPLTIYSDIDAVTGATLSSEATSTASRKAVSLHNLFFLGGKAAKVDAAIAKARQSGAGMIQEAIDTGETLGGEDGPAAAQIKPREIKKTPKK